MARTSYLGLGPSLAELAEFRQDVSDFNNELGNFIIWYYRYHHGARSVFDEVENKNYYPRVQLNAFSMTNVSMAYYDNSGLFQEVDLVVDLAADYLEDLGLDDKLSLEDFFLFENVRYEVKKIAHIARIGNTHALVRLEAIKSKTRIGTVVEEDQVTIKKMLGMIWNVK